MADENQTETVEPVAAEATPEAVEAPETGEETQPEVLDAAALAAELKSAQAQIHKLNEENKNKRLAATKAAEQKQIDEGESKTVAAAAIAARDAMEARVKQANEILLADVKSAIAKWPDKVKALITISDDADALELKKKVLELQPIADDLMNAKAKPGNGAGPTPQGGVSGDDDKTPRPAKYRI